ncbi:MAG TPA: class II aldolase/adducin family protein [Candidatus Binatia bacterium]|nr:class II aldolase/adducin family protein [Candidatus Binatia bacterium]
MDKAELELRKGIIAACRAMNSLGINQGTSGNISARYGGRMLITPTSVPYEDLDPKDIVSTRIKGDGTAWDGRLPPSSEWRFHLRIMQDRPEVGSVVHTHSNYATALAICHKPIPAVHYMVGASGGPDIRVAKYETYGTEELSQAAMQALEGRTCCLLGNHGVIATGSTIKKALWLAVEIETLAKQYYLTLAIGGARILPDDEIARVIEKFKSYGPRGKAAAARKAMPKKRKSRAK